MTLDGLLRSLTTISNFSFAYSYLCKGCGEDAYARTNVGNIQGYCTLPCSLRHAPRAPRRKKWKKPRIREKRAKRIPDPRGRAFSRRGKDHPLWRGGQKKEKEGYVLRKVWVDGKAKWRREHHLVWEAANGRKLDLSCERIHHKNGIRDDNRIENLELVHISRQFSGTRVRDTIAYIGENHADEMIAHLRARWPEKFRQGDSPCSIETWKESRREWIQ